MDAAGLWYLAEVPRTTQVWPRRQPTDAPPAVAVETLAQVSRRRSRVLEGRKGPIVADFAASRTGYREGLPSPEIWVLLRRPLPPPGPTDPTQAPELKYSVSNAAVDTPLDELIRICGMRWPIE